MIKIGRIANLDDGSADRMPGRKPGINHRHPMVGAALLRSQATGQTQERRAAMSETLKCRLRCLHPQVYRGGTRPGVQLHRRSADAGQVYITSQRAKGWILVADDYDDPATRAGI